jgi:hypothetical protein
MSSLRSRRAPRQLLAAVAAAALLMAACGQSQPELTDPVEILQAGATSLGEMDTLHLRGTIDGDVPLSIGGAGGGAPLPLDGTTLEGDVDVAGSELAVEILAPALLNLRVNLVVADGSLYLRAPILTGEKWARQSVGSGAGLDPGAALSGLAEFLARPELEPTKLPDVRCVGTDCYSVQLTVPAAEVRAALGTLGDVIPGLSSTEVGDVTVTAGIRKDNRQLATLALDVPAGGTDTLAIALEISKVNEPVTIEAPPADQVTDSPGGLPGLPALPGG